MRKESGNESRLCMFCCKGPECGQMSREHFVPKGLWADARPQFTKTVPAHRKCNEAWAHDNEYLVICLSWTIVHPEILKLYDGKMKRKLGNAPRANCSNNQRRKWKRHSRKADCF